MSEADKRAVIGMPGPGTERPFPRDAYIVREGEPTTVCTLLITGFAYRQKLVNDGSRQIISFHIPGEFVDLQNGLLDVADHNVQCLTSCRVAIVPKGAVLELMAASPNAGRAIWLDTLIDSSIFREWVVNVGRRDAGRASRTCCASSLPGSKPRASAMARCTISR